MLLKNNSFDCAVARTCKYMPKTEISQELELIRASCCHDPHISKFISSVVRSSTLTVLLSKRQATKNQTFAHSNSFTKV